MQTTNPWVPSAPSPAGTSATPPPLADGFATAMFIAAGLVALGGLVAWTMIRGDVLEDEPAATLPVSHHRNCAVDGAPLRPAGSSAATR